MMVFKKEGNKSVSQAARRDEVWCFEFQEFGRWKPWFHSEAEGRLCCQNQKSGAVPTRGMALSFKQLMVVAGFMVC